MIRKASIAAVCAALTIAGTAAGADDKAGNTIAADTIPAAVAHQVVDRTIELVESKGLYPRQQAEYAQAKSELLGVFDGQPADIGRKDLYGRLRKLLGTLDTNGHSFIMPAGRQPQSQSQSQRQGNKPEDLRPPSFKLLTTSRGTVLRWTPPAIVGSGMNVVAPYLKGFYDEAATRPDLAQACALVVDLSEQTGGNAWPPFVAMYPLFGGANKAKWVDRDGRRSDVVSLAMLQRMNRDAAGERANPLARFGSGPLAVVVSKRTASAGEMLLVALLGEERVQTFGSTSYGMSTANATYPMADGSTLVLTQSRYAVGDGPVYQGGIPAMHPGAQNETVDDAARTAAEWAAANSPACGAKAQAS
jgi:hypothetical protein